MQLINYSTYMQRKGHGICPFLVETVIAGLQVTGHGVDSNNCLDAGQYCKLIIIRLEEMYEEAAVYL